MTVTAEFWFDFASTYSYPAAMRIDRMAEAAGVTVAWRPFLLGPIFAAQGWNDSPFNIYPPKGRYMWRDLQRICARDGITFQRPSRFPRNGLLAARVATRFAAETWVPTFCQAVFAANFAQDREIGEAGVVRGCLDGLGLSGEALIAEAQSEEGKAGLRNAVEQAKSLGSFGAPSFVVAGEVFWGNDRLEDALAWGQPPYTSPACGRGRDAKRRG